jgi:LacI family transcriptional regulator
VDVVAPRSSRRPTLATVAAAAGVSVATVSKVLNGRSDVSAATRALVEQVLRQHDYVAPAPRRPVPERASIEVEFDADLNAYSTEILQGVLTAAAEAGVAAVVGVRPTGRRGGRDRSSAWARDLASAGRSALVAVTSELGPLEVAALRRTRLPAVVVDPLNQADSRVTSIGSTNFAGGLAATEHLLQLGHRRIAYLGGPATAVSDRARLHGYLAALHAQGLPPSPELIQHGRFRYADGRSWGRALLELQRPPTAVFSGNDEQALGVLEAARQRGLRVPDDLSVVGFDDSPVARMVSPPLTTVRQPLREMGAVAVRTALRLAAGEGADSHRMELATELVVRASTARVPDAGVSARAGRSPGCP